MQNVLNFKLLFYAFRFAFFVCLAASLIFNPTFVNAASGGEAVWLVVELKDSTGEAGLREAVREVRRLSTRAPRSYAAAGARRTAADLRRWRIVEVTAQDAPAVLTALSQNPAVASV